MTTYFLDYSFYHLYIFLRRRKRARDPLDGSFYLLTIMGFLFTFPVLMILIGRLLNGLPALLIAVGAFADMFLLNRLIKRYFKRNNRVHNIIVRFKNRSQAQHKLGYFIMLLTFIASFCILVLCLKIGF
jgi:hypothetical protein